MLPTRPAVKQRNQPLEDMTDTASRRRLPRRTSPPGGASLRHRRWPSPSWLRTPRPWRHSCSQKGLRRPRRGPDTSICAECAEDAEGGPPPGCSGSGRPMGSPSPVPSLTAGLAAWLDASSMLSRGGSCAADLRLWCRQTCKIAGAGNVDIALSETHDELLKDRIEQILALA